MNILVYIDTLTGNTTTFVDFLKEKYYNVNIDVINARKISDVDLTKYDKIMIGSYTWSNGKIPLHIKKFVIENREILYNKPTLLFGSGITIYRYFCGALDNIPIIVGRDLPKIKFELTFIPEENEENISLLEEFIKE